MSQVAIITDDAVGGTFVSWSLLWLSGQQNYFSTKKQQYIDLTSNPINTKNSHQFEANHALRLSNVEHFLNTLPNNHLQHIYFHHLSCDGRHSAEQALLDTSAGIDLVAKNCDKVIVIEKPKEYQLYHCKLKKRGNFHFGLNDGTRYTDDNIALDEFINFYFNESLGLWKSQGLEHIWDKREFLALNFRPFQDRHIRDCHSFDFDHRTIFADACWLTLDEHIKSLLDYCNVELDRQRFEHWLDIYTQWKLLHLDRIKFCKSFETIIKHILDGSNIDLEEFDLDIVREATIQHTLIYRHNLNLKTWQLEKFTSTKQLHNLLEPNIHPLSS